MKGCLFFLTVCILSVCAQEPKRCVAPSEMNGKIIAFDTRKGFNVFANFTYDATNKRIRIDESIRLNRTEKGREYFDTIYLFQEKMSYIINLKTNECVKRPIPENEKFHPIAVPLNAQSRGEAVIGTNAGQGIGVTVDLWTGELPEEDGRSFSAWSQTGCFPVQEIVSFSKTGDVLRQSFEDMVLGYDPNRFIPPANCQ